MIAEIGPTRRGGETVYGHPDSGIGKWSCWRDAVSHLLSFELRWTAGFRPDEVGRSCWRDAPVSHSLPVARWTAVVAFAADSIGIAHR